MSGTAENEKATTPESESIEEKECQTEGEEVTEDSPGQVGGYISSQDEIDAYIKKTGGKKKRMFRPCESILTELSTTNKHFQALYHAFMVMILTGIVYSVVQDTVEAGEIWVDLAYYFSGFGPWHQQLLTILLWIPMQLAAFAFYPGFKLWVQLYPRGGVVLNAVFVMLLAVYYLVGNMMVVWSIVFLNLPPVPSLVLSVEQLRCTLKSYSFMRENAYKVLYPWHKDDESGPAVWYGGQMDPKVGSFSQYIYFLYAPTLLYRDHYPRLPRVRWSRVISHLTKCVISITFMTILVKETFDSYPYHGSISFKSVANTFLACMLWGLVMQFMAGYFFLHSWSNLFGELLRFADREFYSDWWTCISFSSFYRKWNLLVHDWIKAYIYQDLKDLFNSRAYNKIASLPAILISALYHEYVLWAPLRFVLPVLLTMYSVFGGCLYFVRPSKDRNFWNYMIHVGLQFGVALNVFFYAMEFIARGACPQEENLLNTFIPRFYECFVLRGNTTVST